MPVLTPAQIAQYAGEAGFTGDNKVKATAVGLAESDGNTDVVNSFGCVGVWQVRASVHMDWAPLSVTQDPRTPQSAKLAAYIQWLKDPKNNAEIAYRVWQAQGWQAGWTTYGGPRYNAALPRATVAANADKSAVQGRNAVTDPAGNVVDPSQHPLEAATGTLDIPNALTAFTNQFRALGLESIVVVVALVCLILGVLLLGRHQAGKVAKVAAKAAIL